MLAAEGAGIRRPARRHWPLLLPCDDVRDKANDDEIS